MELQLNYNRIKLSGQKILPLACNLLTKHLQFQRLLDGLLVALPHHHVLSLAAECGQVLVATRRENQLAERVEGAIRLYRLQKKKRGGGEL